ncbi:hypothetical protein ABZO31_13195 [Streptomyces sp. HUAS MG47]|uniref:hypothetical protein n=1 Tax=Streptomyces solicamelliae TaxID=3231716 RepID=UPI003877DBF3
MYGHGHPQQQRPGQGALIGLRVLFVAMPVLTCGFLAWAPLLRLAILTRRTRDWVVFGLSVLLDITLIAGLAWVGEQKEPSDLSVVLFLINALLLFCGSISYYLVAEIQHFAAPAGPAAVTGGGYGYPSTAATVPSPGYAQPRPVPQPAPPQPQPPVQAPQPPQRIDQVRAELDELSDLLRKEEGK